MNCKMKNDFFAARIKEKYPGMKLLIDEPMSRHSSFRAGGKADMLALPSGSDEIKYLLELVKEHDVPLTVLGNCSNILVKDNGIRGLVLKIACMNKVEVMGEALSCEAGALLSSVAKTAFEHSLKGFEFAAGIPGSVGGGIYMNAGAYGGELKDITVKVKSISLSGDECEWQPEKLDFGYRKSIFTQNGHIITEAVFELGKGDSADIQKLTAEYAERRRSKQPLEYPSAGSTFKRPKGYFAGKLIQDAGLCGFSIGGAAVSEKHAGFVINKNNATASDILQLIEEVQKKVYEHSGVELHPEIRIIGE